jgi:hypothetical protein
MGDVFYVKKSYNDLTKMQSEHGGGMQVFAFGAQSRFGISVRYSEGRDKDYTQVP